MSRLWKYAPGESGPTVRARARKMVVSLIVGVSSIGLAWAGTGLIPSSLLEQDIPAGESVSSGQTALQTTSSGDLLASFDLTQGQILAGASKISIEPRPEDYGGTWERDRAKCATLSPSEAGVSGTATHVSDVRGKWAENPNCIYMGGYGIGPMFPITSYDPEYGLFSRSIAMSDGKDALVLTLLDAVYWQAQYNSMCDGCGFIELAEQLSAETGFAPESFVFASTHSHTSPDFLGGWGGVPDWYMQQTTDALKGSVTQALASMRPAVLEAGEVLARQFSGERRDFYRSAEDDGVSWLRLVEAGNSTSDPCATDSAPAAARVAQPAPTPPDEEEEEEDEEDRPGNGNGNGNGNGGGNGNGNNGNGNGNGGPRPSPSPSASPSSEPSPSPSPTEEPSPEPSPSPTVPCEPPAPGPAIATIGAYAAHPVTVNHEAGVADADFPGVFAKSVEERFGGVGMFLQTGLGNISPRGDKVKMGTGLASVIPDVGKGTQITNTDVKVGRTFWDQPVTNGPLGGLGLVGIFDRKFNQTPAMVREGKGPENRKCHSASAVSVKTSVSAAKIGPVWFTGGPGELFSNLTNTVEEKNPGGITFALGLVNDGLGYIIQSFETDHVGRQGAGFVGKAGPVGVAEYEDAYSLDHCFGDATLEHTLRLLDTL